MRELSACDFCDGEAAGVYEVVPGDIPGVSTRRMVLCDDCRDTLSEVVDPLLAAGRRGGRANSEADSSAHDAAGVGEDATASDVGEAGHASREAPATGTPKSAPESAPEPEPELDSESAPEPEPDSGAGGEEPDAEPQAAPERIERPEGYGKVVRLVENRDAGIPRADLETLASSAYGLSMTDVDAAIDFAIEQGRFEETESGLRAT